MARTPLFRTLRRLARRSQQPDAPAAGPSRRDFLGALGAVALVPVIGACGDNVDPTGARASVAIIGGGIAGLTAAHFLALGGIRAEVFEASMRVGGRMYTQHGLQGDQICELGGELVDSNHTVIPALARAYGLTLDDLPAATAGLQQDTYFLDSAEVSEAAIVTAFTPVAARMQAAIMAGDADATEFSRIDNMSISEWLENEAGLAPTEMIRRLLEIAYLEEFGLEVDQQSAWNLITLIDSTTPDPFRVFGDSDEVFHIHQGSQSIPDAIAARLADQIRLDHALTKVTQAGSRYELTFTTAAGEVVVLPFDHVVYALPFTKLREVDLSGAGLTAEKQMIIEQLGYGTNAKLMMQFTSRPWETAHRSNGSMIGTVATPPVELQTTWATSRGQDGDEGILTNFVGGSRGVAIGDGTAEAQAQAVLPGIEQVWPGTQAAYIAGSAIRQHWPSYPFTKGSYAAYRKGQWAFFGLEGKRVDNQHFCGEHCSENFQGYMEGGAETGTMVAAEIYDDLGIAKPPVLAGLVGALTATPRASYHAGWGERMKLGQIRR